jgi:hypothetical protein
MLDLLDLQSLFVTKLYEEAPSTTTSNDVTLEGVILSTSRHQQASWLHSSLPVKLYPTLI